MVSLLGKDEDNGDVQGNIEPNRKLTLVIGSRFGEAQTCAVSSKSIHDNRHLMRYIIEMLMLDSVGPDQFRTVENFREGIPLLTGSCPKSDRFRTCFQRLDCCNA